MKKVVFIPILVLLLTALAIDSLIVKTAKSSYTQAKTSYSPDTILILIEEELYPKIEESLALFEQDLGNEEYQVIETTVSSQLSPPDVKTLIKSYYVENNITGAILIGNIKAAYSEIRTGDYSNPEALKIWISLDAVDMYYMDMDGYWENVTHPDFYAHMPSNVAEVNLYPSCETFCDEYIVYLDETKKWDYNAIENKTQYQAEIWVSRIMAHNLDISGKNESRIVNDFFSWDHNYRTGQEMVSDKAYLLNAINTHFQNMNYSEVFGTVVKKEYVAKNDYLACLEDSNGSKLMYLLAHSSPTLHSLYDTYVTTNDLANKNKTSVFYILNACSSCRWDHYTSSPADPNYLGGLYAFDTSPSRRNCGLGAIGFTGVGGFNWLEYFANYLNDNLNSSYGEAYKYWFNRNLMHIFGTTNYVYLGDPTIGPVIHQLPVHNLDTGLNYTSIQEAINANETLDGHTILVDAGTYYEHVSINKSISLIGENRSTTVIDGNGTGTVVSIYSSFVTVRGFTIQNSGFFVGLPSGVEMGSANCTISNNDIKSNKGGISLLFGGNHTITNNTISSNYYGIYIVYSQNNKIFHNYFLNNTNQTYSTGAINTWDNGYPSGGNYWSDYEDRYPDAEEINGSGIWDTPYVIYSTTAPQQDNYPIIPEFPTWTSMLLILIVLTVAIAIYKRRLLKTPIQ